MNAETDIYGIIGNPINKSFSPTLHTKMFKRYHINAVYAPFESDNIKNAIAGLRGLSIKGVNITLPYKEKAFSLIDQADKDAQILKSVNTIKNVNGKLYGYNTDFKGFMEALKNNFNYRGKNITLMGAGGAARGVIYALHKLGIRKINVINRTISRAETLQKEFSDLIKINVCGLNAKKTVGNSDIIINTTSVGLKNSNVPIDIKNIEKSDIIDIIYPDTELIKQAKLKGLHTMNGTEMFINQAFYSFKIWTGVEFDRKVALNIMKDFYK